MLCSAVLRLLALPCNVMRIRRRHTALCISFSSHWLWVCSALTSLGSKLIFRPFLPLLLSFPLSFSLAWQLPGPPQPLPGLSHFSPFLFLLLPSPLLVFVPPMTCLNSYPAGALNLFASSSPAFHPSSTLSCLASFLFLL